MDNQTIKWLRKLIDDNRMIPFYKSKEWRKIRLEALKRDNYECQECKRKGKYSRAQNVHHIKEVKLYPEKALELNNLESICIVCHNKEHNRFGTYGNKNKIQQFANFDSKECW